MGRVDLCEPTCIGAVHAHGHPLRRYSATFYFSALTRRPAVGTLRSCQKAAIEHSRVELKRLHNSQTATADLAQELADLAQLIEQETAEIDDDGDDD